MGFYYVRVVLARNPRLTLLTRTTIYLTRRDFFCDCVLLLHSHISLSHFVLYRTRYTQADTTPHQLTDSGTHRRSSPHLMHEQSECATKPLRPSAPRAVCSPHINQTIGSSQPHGPLSRTHASGSHAIEYTRKQRQGETGYARTRGAHHQVSISTHRHRSPRPREGGV